jgi:hypothetical protein
MLLQGQQAAPEDSVEGMETDVQDQGTTALPSEEAVPEKGQYDPVAPWIKQWNVRTQTKINKMMAQSTRLMQPICLTSLLLMSGVGRTWRPLQYAAESGDQDLWGCVESSYDP